MAPTLSGLISETGSTPADERMLRALVKRLAALSCKGVANKVAEYKGCGRRAQDLIAELRMALALAECTGAAVHLQAGDAHDLRLAGPNLDCTVEIEHKSSVSAFAAVFYPEPHEIAAYGLAKDGWRATSFRLHEALKALPFEIQPWIDGELSAPCWNGRERARQEDTCGQLAAWLLNELASVRPGASVQLRHALARFDMAPLAVPPGEMLRYQPLEAFVLGDASLSGWLRDAIRRKTELAAENPARRGQQHLIGLVIDEAFACAGHALATVLLGGLVAELDECGRSRRHYRASPAAGRGLFDEACHRGRSELLSMTQLDRDKSCGESEQGLVFDKALPEHVDGVLATYYTGALQFIPNPFTPRDLDPICALFPKTLAPFEPFPRQPT